MYAASGASAQLPQTSAVAARMAVELEKAKQDSVVVFGFVGPGEQLNGLGVYLSRDFTKALATRSSEFAVLDQTKFDELFEKHPFKFSAVRDSSTAIWAAHEVGANSVVLGHLSTLDEKIVLELFSFRTGDRSPIAGFKTSFPITSDMRTLVAMQYEDASQTPHASVPLAGENGYSRPSCIHCPAAKYDDRAMREGAQGNVNLSITVGKDGRAHDIVVVRALPYGLAEKAIDAVSTWSFKSAVGPDGKPADVRQDVVVTFHLYKKPGNP